MTGIRRALFALQDAAYADFQRRLMPTVDPDTVIGVRTPQLRRLAKALARTHEADAFLRALPHAYYEENNLHALLIGEIRDFDACVEAVDRFLPFVDNWATCDGMTPGALERESERLLPHIDRWLTSGETYTVRWALVLLMRVFLKERFDETILERAASVAHGDYYVKMAVAWFFATALTHQYDAALPYMERRWLERWTHNKAIQKAVESDRIPADRKAYLKTLRMRRQAACGKVDR